VAKKIGDKICCSLCGGGGYVSEPYPGRYDTTCPSCDGTGRMPWHPLCVEPPCMGLALCNACLKCFRHCICQRRAVT
jgi:hypothetical protein